MTVTKLATHRVQKPWGRHQLWPGFQDPPGDGEPVGEIWFEHPKAPSPDLLIKYIFTSANLSVQVHPNDAQAHAVGLPRGKDECWLILDAKPDAVIALGMREPCDRQRLRNAALDGSIESLLDWKRVKAGDFFYVAAGTVHAIGAGITLVEVQQNSDTTYRLYDYGRPRELHLDQGIMVSDPSPYRPYPDAVEVASGRALLVNGPKFVLERLTGTKHVIDVPPRRIGHLIVVTGEGNSDQTRIRAGECFAVQGRVVIDMKPGSDVLLAFPCASTPCG